MNEKKNLINLVDKISAETGLDRQLVTKFTTQLFKEIEKELIISSFAQIENLGIFRIIKSVSSEKILFLDKFNNRSSAGVTPNNNRENQDNISRITKEEKIDIIQEDDKNRYTTISDILNEPSDKFDDNNDTIITSNDSENVEKVSQDDLNSEKENLEVEEIDDSTYFYNYQEQNKKRLSTRIRVIGITTVAILIFIATLLYFLYPKDINQNMNNGSPSYTEIVNGDSINFKCVIKIESNTDYLALSKIYYNHEIFWPYIYNANDKDGVEHSLEVLKGSIIKIPKLDSVLFDLNNQESINAAKTLAINILRQKDGYIMPLDSISDVQSTNTENSSIPCQTKE